jgi:hypothetical protein
MWHLPGKKILPGKKSGNTTGQEISPASNATRRKACIYGSSGQDPPRTILQTVARHVDFAASES